MKNVTYSSKNLRKARTQAKYSQEQLAEALNCSRALIGKWENGNCSPSLEQAAAMSKLLGCDLAYLAGIQEEPKREFEEYGKYTGLSSEAIEILHEKSKAKDGDMFLSLISNLISERTYLERFACFLANNQLEKINADRKELRKKMGGKKRS